MRVSEGRVSERREMTPAGLYATGHGELLSVQYPVEPRLLEETLEALAHAPFPINPQLRHPAPGGSSWRTMIEFPAYADQIDSLAGTLRAFGLDAKALTTSPMLEAISA
jgi:hypothetical protein